MIYGFEPFGFVGFIFFFFGFFLQAKAHEKNSRSREFFLDDKIGCEDQCEEQDIKDIEENEGFDKVMILFIIELEG